MNSQLRISVLLVALVIGLSACSNSGTDKSTPKMTVTDNAAITFLELGSVNCIPCKQMQPVMKSVETRYAGQVNVIFHDVMKDRTMSQKYGIKLIPTQVFLDSSGKELMRHEGFFPEEDIDKFLQAQGLAPTY